MFTTAIRTRIAEVLSFVLGGAGIIAILIMVLGLLVDFNAGFWVAWTLGTGALAGVVIVPLFWKGVHDSSDLNFWVILADLVFMTGALASQMVSDWRWWMALLVYVMLVAVGLTTCVTSSIYLVQVGGAVLLLAGVMLAVTVLAYHWIPADRPMSAIVAAGAGAGLYAAATITRMWEAAME